MKIIYNHSTWVFRPCDTKNITQNELQKMANEIGKIKYEPGRRWLIIPGIGYGCESLDIIEEL